MTAYRFFSVKATAPVQ